MPEMPGQPAGGLDEGDKNVKRATAAANRFVSFGQRALRREQAKRTKGGAEESSGLSDRRPDDRSDAGGQRHCQRAPESHARSGSQNVRTTGPGPDRTQERKETQ